MKRDEDGAIIKKEKEEKPKKIKSKIKKENDEIIVEETITETNKSSKKILKKIIISILVVILLILGTCIYLLQTNSLLLTKYNLIETAQKLGFSSKTYKFFNNISKEDAYIMTMKSGNIDLDYRTTEEVTITMAKKDKNSYFAMKTAVEDTVIFSKGKMAYMLINEDKEYYETEAEQEEENLLFLTKEELEDMKKEKYTNGIENIADDKLYYEEYKESEENKVKYYFKDNKLKYILSIAGTETELVEITVSENKVEDKLFEVPKGYIKKDLNELIY